MSFYVYILEGTQKFFYCGMTQEIVSRYIQHNRKGSKSTMWNTPYVLKFLIEIDSRQKARFIEKQIKNYGVKRWYDKNKFQTCFVLSSRLIELKMHQIKMESGSISYYARTSKVKPTLTD